MEPINDINDNFSSKARNHPCQINKKVGNVSRKSTNHPNAIFLTTIWVLESACFFYIDGNMKDSKQELDCQPLKILKTFF